MGDKIRSIYCHFSFKRPKGKNYGIFAVAFYEDFDGKKLITYKVRKMELWENHQFITAIQSYEHALRTIHEYQGMMLEAGIKQVMLVTDNSILAGWIENPNKRKDYAEYMRRAVKPYRVGGPKEIVLGIGLCEPRDYEKSYKYCKEELAINECKQLKVINGNGVNKLQITNYKSVLDIMDEMKSMPEIVGINEVGDDAYED